MSKNILSICFCVFICFKSLMCQLYEGSDCDSEADSVKGRCVELHRCLAAAYDLKRKKYPQICSFKGRDPIICCTDCELVSDIGNVLVDNEGSNYFKTGRKATDKCLEHLVRLDYPCPLLQGVKRERLPGYDCYSYSRPFIAAAVGGVDAKQGEYPHMALLGYGDDLQSAEWLCGGSVISDKFILTAAHCISTSALGSVKYVALGILKRTDPPEQWQRYRVSRVIPHPQYKAPNKYHDIALLELDTKIKFGRNVLPACLNTGSVGENWATATGWGALGHRKSLADTLQVVTLYEFTAEECAAAYPPHRLLPNGYDHKTQSCYGDKNNITDTCLGDSGGPLQITSEHGSCVYNIIGLTSYGRACGFQGNAGMYTRVAYYVPWIESVVWP